MTEPIPTREQILAAYDAEEAALKALLARISEEQWSGPARADGWKIHDIVGHIGDSAYGLARLSGMTPEQSSGLDIHALNEQRRAKNTARSRAEIEERVGSGFAAARAALTPELDLSAPSPFLGRNVGELLMVVALHTAGHRQEIEALLG
jgi:uncharacterized protein (TIGR03083 family)